MALILTMAVVETVTATVTVAATMTVSVVVIVAVTARVIQPVHDSAPSPFPRCEPGSLTPGCLDRKTLVVNYQQLKNALHPQDTCSEGLGRSLWGGGEGRRWRGHRQTKPTD